MSLNVDKKLKQLRDPAFSAYNEITGDYCPNLKELQSETHLQTESSQLEP